MEGKSSSVALYVLVYGSGSIVTALNVSSSFGFIVDLVLVIGGAGGLPDSNVGKSNPMPTRLDQLWRYTCHLLIYRSAL